jgi:outer membrane protein assembly factor BamB
MPRRALLSFVVIGAVLTTLVPPAQALSVTWRERIGTAQVDAAIAPDGSIYTAGQERRSITAAATLTKSDASGQVLWQRHWLPNTDASTVPVSVTVANDGTIYLLGIARGQCEGEGWFVRAYRPGGSLRWRYVTPGWQCSIAEAATGIAVHGDRVVVSGISFGCCGDPFHDGWLQSFDRMLHPKWRADVEPPTTPSNWFDTATGVVFGASGNIYVSGWAATRGNITESSPTPGTPIIEKFTAAGHRVWSVRADVKVPSMFLPVAIDSKGKRVDVAGGVFGFGVAWGMAPTTGWVASYSTSGDLRWQHRFGGERRTGVLPTGIAMGARDRVWVESTMRDPDDRGTDVLVRTYRAKGSLIDVLRIDSKKRRIMSGDITNYGVGAVATGWLGNEFQFHGGRVWRLGP